MREKRPRSKPCFRTVCERSDLAANPVLREKRPRSKPCFRTVCERSDLAANPVFELFAREATSQQTLFSNCLREKRPRSKPCFRTVCERSDLAANPVFELFAREATSQQTLFYSNPVEVIFVSLCEDTNDVPCISAPPVNRAGEGVQLSHCRQRLLFAVQVAFFSAFSLLDSLDKVLVRFRMSKIFLMRFSVVAGFLGWFFFFFCLFWGGGFCLPDVRFHHLS